MILVELLQTAVIAVVVGFLAISNGLADHITSLGSTPQTNETVQENVPTEDSSPSELTHIDSSYGANEVIPRILIENAEYQKAAVGAGVGNEAILLTETKKTIEEKIHDSLVNVYCQYKTGTYKRTTTGTGFFIHQNGVVLTNAHVAQFLLFAETDMVQDASCVLRGGDPAEPLYEAELLYIPPAWISENAKLVSEAEPVGTGERDYALLYVTDTIASSTRPNVFPALSFDTSLLTRDVENDAVLAGGYPAERLYENGAATGLEPIVATTTISTLYTFGSNYADVFSVKGSLVGGQGSSGGPVLRNEKAIGLIVTRGDDAIDGKMSLRALTLSYIDRTITEETGFSLRENMRGDLEQRAQIFKEALTPFLTRLLTQNLE